MMMMAMFPRLFLLPYGAVKFDAAAHRGQRSNEGFEGRARGRNVLILYPNFFCPKWKTNRFWDLVSLRRNDRGRR